MGCECCKIDNPERYEKCKVLVDSLKARHKIAIAPCGGTDIGEYRPGEGGNYTPPKRKSKKRKKFNK